jgi:hypothetical protein
MTLRFSNIKFKILTYTLALPLVWATVIIIKLLFPTFIFNLGITIGLFIGSILRLFIIDRRYLTGFAIEDDVLTISYLTQFVREKSLTFSQDEVFHIEYKKRGWLRSDFDYLSFSHKNMRERFYLLDKKIKADAKIKSETAKVSL